MLSASDFFVPSWYNFTFLTSFSHCDNGLVRACFSIISNNTNYILGKKLAYFRDRFAININRCTLNDNIKKIKLSTVISNYNGLLIIFGH